MLNAYFLLDTKNPLSLPLNAKKPKKEEFFETQGHVARFFVLPYPLYQQNIYSHMRLTNKNFTCIPPLLNKQNVF